MPSPAPSSLLTRSCSGTAKGNRDGAHLGEHPDASRRLAGRAYPWCRPASSRAVRWLSATTRRGSGMSASGSVRAKSARQKRPCAGRRWWRGQNWTADTMIFEWCCRPPSGRSGLPPTRGDWHRTPSFRSACRRTVGSLDLGCFAKWSSVYVGSRTLLRHAGRLAAELDCRVQAKDRGGWLSTDTTTVPDDVCGPEKRSKTLDRTLKSASRAPFRPSVRHTRKEAAHRCSYERPLWHSLRTPQLPAPARARGDC